MSASSSRAPAPKTRARRDSNHIPRPPNAFILFRSAFIRSQQIPDRVEGNHSNLSKIIGHYWKTLSPQERAEWEAKAVEAQEEHRQKYPDWRFRPGPYAVGKTKIKEAGPKRSAANTPKDEDHELQSAQTTKKRETSETKGRGKGKGKEKEGAGGRAIPEGRERRDSRCEKIASLIVAGKTGADLASAVEEWEGNPALSTSSHLPSSSTSNLGKTQNRSGHALSLSHSTSSPHHRSPPTNASTKPKLPIKGISEVPLTQMFVTDRPARQSVPGIAGANTASHYDAPPLTASSTSSNSSTFSATSWRQNDSDESPTLPFHSGSSPGSDGTYWWNPDASPSVPVPNVSFIDKDRPTGQRQQAATLGYEPTQATNSWDRGFQKFGQFDDLPQDGSETGSWTCGSTQQRHGLMSMIHDPCSDQEAPESQLGQSVATLSPQGYSDLPPLSLPPLHPGSTKSHPHSPGSGISLRTTPTMGSPSMPAPFFNQRFQPSPHLHQHQHHSQDGSSPHLLLPPTSYSTLTGWAGEYDYDPTLPPISSKIGVSSDSYPQHTRSVSDSFSSSSGGFDWQTTPTMNPSHAWPELHGGHNLGVARAPEEWEEADTTMHFSHIQGMDRR